MTAKRIQAARTLTTAGDTKRRVDMQPGLPTGYSDQLTGDTLPVQGDEHAPWFKDQVIIGEPVSYTAELTGNILPAADTIDELTIFPEIDVREARLLTLFVLYRGFDAEASPIVPTICMLPETAAVFEDQRAPEWFFYGVVNPVLYGSGLYGVSAYESIEPFSTAFRDVFVGPLYWTPGTDGAPLPATVGTPRNLQLSFDVSDKTSVRFRFGSVKRLAADAAPAVGVEAEFFYQLQR
jgi:hypothetical protein